MPILSRRYSFANSALRLSFLTAAAFLAFAAVPKTNAQETPATPPAPPDLLVFVNGERLTGHFDRADQGGVVFRSDMAGVITVPWDKVRELRSSNPYAILPKDRKYRTRADARDVPQGAVAIAEQKVQISPPSGETPQTLPVSDVAQVLDESAYRQALEAPGVLRNWKGAITASVSLVAATQDSRTVNTNIALNRSDPTVSWLPARNRTIVNFSSAYGVLTQPDLPTVKTNIFHADGEQDRYFSPRLFTFGQAAFDHNYAQGLRLQQNYVGGLGMTLLKRERQQLDFKGSLGYLTQSFQDPSFDQHLIGSLFSETFTRTFSRGAVLSQMLSVTPAWNNLEAYTATANVTLSIPVHKRLQVTISAIDNYLNNPVPGFQKNSFQLTTGLTLPLP